MSNVSFYQLWQVLLIEFERDWQIDKHTVYSTAITRFNEQTNGMELNDILKYIKYIDSQNLTSFYHQNEALENFKTYLKAKHNNLQTAIHTIQKKDDGYYIKGYVTNEIQHTGEYEYFNNLIERDGFMTIINVSESYKIYTAELMYLLSTDEISCFDRNSKKESLINGSDFIMSYIYGYKMGRKYFIENHTVPVSILYSDKSENYISDLHQNCYHNTCYNGKKGWAFVKRNYPVIISDKVIEKYGYYSGIISEIENLVSKYPTLFSSFHQCSNQSSENTEKENILSFSNIFTISDWTKYIDVLTLCNPKLLEKHDNKYKFVGNQKTQKGCIAQWFKYLKIKGLIKADINRDTLAATLSQEISNYSINGSSIDNISTTYQNNFESQLIGLLESTN